MPVGVEVGLSVKIEANARSGVFYFLSMHSHCFPFGHNQFPVSFLLNRLYELTQRLEIIGYRAGYFLYPVLGIYGVCWLAGNFVADSRKDTPNVLVYALNGKIHIVSDVLIGIALAYHEQNLFFHFGE